MHSTIQNCEFANQLAPISVLISVYKNSKVSEVEEALKSIWDNQNLKPSQIVLVEDGPLANDLSLAISDWVNRLPDIFTVFHIPTNSGLRHALNVGLALCKHELIARMDSDDISLSYRFEKQFTFMKQHPEIDVVGGAVEEWDDGFSTLKQIKHLPLTHQELIEFAKYRSPFNHPTVMFRKHAVIDVGGYPNLFPEDYALWVLLIQSGAKFANVSETLVKMRTDSMLDKRRGGWRLLKQEVNLYKHFYKSGFLSYRLLILNVGIRSILRLSPTSIRNILYKICRK